MFCRAISKDDISSIGYCQLINNRVVKRLNRPVLFPEHDYERKGIKDPRIALKSVGLEELLHELKTSN